MCFTFKQALKMINISYICLIWQSKFSVLLLHYEKNQFNSWTSWSTIPDLVYFSLLTKWNSLFSSTLPTSGFLLRPMGHEPVTYTIPYSQCHTVYSHTNTFGFLLHGSRNWYNWHMINNCYNPVHIFCLVPFRSPCVKWFS